MKLPLGTPPTTIQNDETLQQVSVVAYTNDKLQIGHTVNSRLKK